MKLFIVKIKIKLIWLLVLHRSDFGGRKVVTLGERLLDSYDRDDIHIDIIFYVKPITEMEKLG